MEDLWNLKRSRVESCLIRNATFFAHNFRSSCQRDFNKSLSPICKEFYSWVTSQTPKLMVQCLIYKTSIFLNKIQSHFWQIHWFIHKKYGKIYEINAVKNRNIQIFLCWFNRKKIHLKNERNSFFHILVYF